MRAPLSFALSCAVVSAAVAACYVGPIDERKGGTTTGGSPTDPVSALPGGEGGAPSDSAASGLPCEIDALLEKRCRGCHVSGGSAPMPLVTYEDLTALRATPARSTAILSFERMVSPDRPMPPSGERATSSETAAWRAWIESGSPRGTCGEPSATDGGTKPVGKSDGSAPSSTLPGAGQPPVCTSAMTWSGNQKGPSMQPGRACITCHESQENDPVVWIGGTVYPSLHEPDGCYGSTSATGAVVVVTDATGREVTMTLGPTGNFSLNAKSAAPVVMPIRAKVVRNGVERAMASPQSSGNCNGCHTQNGANGAPGRIVLP